MSLSLSPLPSQRCDRCKEVGATVGCCTSTCSANYHFQCARLAKCVFLTNKEVYCQQHRGTADEEDILPEADINVARCIFVETHPDSSGKKIQRVFEADKLSVKIGNAYMYMYTCTYVHTCMHVHVHCTYVCTCMSDSSKVQLLDFIMPKFCRITSCTQFGQAC